MSVVALICEKSFLVKTKAIHRQVLRAFVMSSSIVEPQPASFQPSKAVILSKVSRYEFERRRHQTLNDDDFFHTVSSRGSDPVLMQEHHNVHEKNLNRLVQALELHGLKTRVIKRSDYTDEVVRWADVVFTAGGDGTFLMGASKIQNNRKPIIGINTDPTRSTGVLCLPNALTDDMDTTIGRLLKGSFSWYMRKRLRITLIGDNDRISEPAVELHTQKLQYPEYRYVELLNEKHDSSDHPLREVDEVKKAAHIGQRVLPVLALNEVFVGESLSSRVSYLEVKFDEEGGFVKTRNSGLCISTGTGSTSWTFNINKLTEQSVRTILGILAEKNPSVDNNDQELITQITTRFNNSIKFDPDIRQMAYTLRDPIQIGSEPGSMDHTPRGIVSGAIEVKSRCFDACLVIDGSLSFKFNDGTRAIIEMTDEDDLRTVRFDIEAD